MTKLVAGLIDVFADAPLRGNPLAVVEGGETLDDGVLRHIAREFNQAETTFLMPSKRADWKLRSFTASGSEVFGAGHNALGAWLWLGYQGRLGDLDAARTLRQEIGPDVLPITISRTGRHIVGRMRQAALTLRPPLTEFFALAAALGLSEADILSKPPPQTADTGAGHLMVRVVSASVVDRCEPDAARLLPVLAGAGAEGCYVYACDESAPDTAYSRFFNPTVGLWEDAATGTAAGPLTALLGEQNLLNADKTLVIEQGTRMGRQSYLRVQLGPDAELSGGGVVVFRGELQL